jgi:hypothetical protein
MIVRGEFNDTHRERITSLVRPARVVVIPRGALSAEGLKRFRTYSKVFLRHAFVMVGRSEWLTTSAIRKAWKDLGGQNVFVYLIPQEDPHGTLGEHYARLEKAAAAHTKMAAGSRSH